LSKTYISLVFIKTEKRQFLILEKALRGQRSTNEQFKKIMPLLKFIKSEEVHCQIIDYCTPPQSAWLQLKSFCISNL